MCRNAISAVVFFAFIFGCHHVNAAITISVGMGTATSQGCDVSIKISLNFVPVHGQEDVAVAVVALLNDMVLSSELFHDANFFVTNLTYGLHEVTARALKRGEEIASTSLSFTLYHDLLLPAIAASVGDNSPDIVCDHTQDTSGGITECANDPQPRLWILMNDWAHHAHLVSNRKSTRFQYPDATTPVLSKFVARGAAGRHISSHTCSASVLLQFSYVHERINDNSTPAISACGEYLLITELVQPLPLVGVNVSSEGMRQVICFSNQNHHRGQSTSMNVFANVSTSITVAVACPPYCSGQPVDVHVKTRMIVGHDSILPAQTNAYTVTLLCNAIDDPEGKLLLSSACNCETSDCTAWSSQMVGPVYLAPNSTTVSINFSTSGARIASAYEVYWAYSNNIAGGIKWHGDASAPNGFAALHALGDTVVTGCGICLDGQIIRFRYPWEFVGDIHTAFQFVARDLAPSACLQHVFMTLPHKPHAALVHNMMRQHHDAFVNGSAWTLRSCRGACSCSGEGGGGVGQPSSSGDHLNLFGITPIGWTYDAESDLIEFLDAGALQRLPEHAHAQVRSGIYQVVSRRQMLEPLARAFDDTADDDAIVEIFLDNGHLPYAHVHHSPFSHHENDTRHTQALPGIHPKVPRIAALMFGELRIISREFIDNFNAAVISSIGADVTDMFLVLRPFHKPRCFEGFCSPCSIAKALFHRVKACLEYDVPRTSSHDAQGSSDPAGISRLEGAPFSRKWQNHGHKQRFEGSSLGSPPGWYLWQPLQLAFSLALVEERALLSRYSYMLRLRLDTVYSTFKPAVRWHEELSKHGAYVRGHVNEGGRLSQWTDQNIILGRERVARFVRLLSHVSVTGLDTTLPGTRSACVSDHIPYAHVTSHSALYGANAVYSECAVMWALHRAYGVANVGLLPMWANWEVVRPPMD